MFNQIEHMIARTDAGEVYKHNEDFCLLPDTLDKYGITPGAVQEKGALFILTDGMEGGQAKNADWYGQMGTSPENARRGIFVLRSMAR